MLIQLVIGSIAILVSMGVIVGFVSLAMRLIPTVDSMLSKIEIPSLRLFTMLSVSVILILIASTVCVWMWAALFRSVGVFPTLEEAVYFALVSISTVGYGDVVVQKDWRVLSGFIAVNGLLAFGIFTAFLIEVMRDVSKRLPSDDD